MKKAIESVRRGAQQPEGLARLTDCDDDRMLPPNVTGMAPKALAQKRLRHVLATQLAFGQGCQAAPNTN